MNQSPSAANRTIVAKLGSKPLASAWACQTLYRSRSGLSRLGSLATAARIPALSILEYVDTHGVTTF
ncbi:MAG: hypothetical protein QNJ41_04595 [Xenococcaceae cyanobacterium MO_188.B32]|nr:hypothetical protein [Xenococcaceae cyanobacterium MO_188.B32]